MLRSDGPLEAGRVTTLQRIGAALPIATDAAFFPDRRHLIVRNYGSAIVYAYPSLDEVGGFALPDQEQGEGIAVDAQGVVFVSSEGEGAPVLRVPLPDDVREAMTPDPAPEPEPEPEAGSATADSQTVAPDAAQGRDR